MIHIQERTKKRTQYHIRYIYDHDGKTHEAVHKIPTKVYDTLSEQQILSRVRAAANRERAKKIQKKEDPEEIVEDEE